MLLLNGWGVGCLGVLWLIGGQGQGGLRPYYQEVARHSFSEWQLFLYILLICSYAMALEAVLPLLQWSTARRLGLAGGVVVAAIAYGLTHLKFHPGAAVYALMLGGGTAIFYARTKRLTSLMLWHAQWELGAIAFVIGTAIVFSGPARTTMLHEYKTDQLQRGELTYVQGWGWIDANHNWSGEITALAATLHQSRGQTVGHAVRDGFTVMVSDDIFYTHHYLIDVPADADDTACHALASLVYFDVGLQMEARQSDEPVYSGAFFSAYAFEDLPSVLYSAWSTREGATLPTASPEEAQTRWERDGWDLVDKHCRSLRAFKPANDQTADLVDHWLDSLQAYRSAVRLENSSMVGW